jgi:hypothetical protein
VQQDVVDWDAFWVAEDGSTTRLSLGEWALPSPLLVAAADGAPWLAQRDGATEGNTATQLYRFNPWRARFEASDIFIELGNAVEPPPTVLDPGAFTWLEERAGQVALWGLRFSTRNRYSTDLGLIALTAPEDAEWPLHLSPGAPPGDTTTQLETVDLNGVPRRVLALRGGSVWVTDTRYQNFALSITLEGGASPALLLGASAETYTWPTRDHSSLRQELSATREGSLLTLSCGDESRSYDVSEEPVSIGFRASDDAGDAFLALLSALSVRRLAP